MDLIQVDDWKQFRVLVGWERSEVQLADVLGHY